MGRPDRHRSRSCAGPGALARRPRHPRHRPAPHRSTHAQRQEPLPAAAPRPARHRRRSDAGQGRRAHRPTRRDDPARHHVRPALADAGPRTSGEPTPSVSTRPSCAASPALVRCRSNAPPPRSRTGSSTRSATASPHRQQRPHHVDTNRCRCHRATRRRPVRRVGGRPSPRPGRRHLRLRRSSRHANRPAPIELRTAVIPCCSTAPGTAGGPSAPPFLADTCWCSPATVPEIQLPALAAVGTAVLRRLAFPDSDSALGSASRTRVSIVSTAGRCRTPGRPGLDRLGRGRGA